jgi:hypothetical protein
MPQQGASRKFVIRIFIYTGPVGYTPLVWFEYRSPRLLGSSCAEHVLRMLCHLCGISYDAQR